MNAWKKKIDKISVFWRARNDENVKNLSLIKLGLENGNLRHPIAFVSYFTLSLYLYENLFENGCIYIYIYV